MSEAPLVVRYSSDWPSPWSPEGERTYGQRERDERRLALARQQLESQQEQAREIVRSNLAGAAVVARELQQQTTALAASIDGLGSRIFQVESKVDEVGRQICVSLEEVRWQLEQQGETLRGILETLRTRRRVEARELVTQGVLLSHNEEYEEAEERFLAALELDKIDYQVLLNLAFIEIHKGRGSEASAYFEKALTRPARLSSGEKRRVLRAWAQLHHAEGRHREALEMAQVAMSLTSRPDGEEQLRCAIYAAWAGDREQCVARLDAALDSEPSLMARSMVDPGLEPMRDSVRSRLLAKADAAWVAASDAFSEADAALRSAAESVDSEEDSALLESLEVQMDRLEEDLESAGFQESLRVEARARVLRRAAEELQKLEPRYRDCERTTSKMRSAESRWKGVQSLRGQLQKEAYPIPPVLLGCGFAVVAIGSYPITMLGMADLFSRFGMGGLGGCLGVLIWVALGLVLFFGSKRYLASVKAKNRKIHARISAEANELNAARSQETRARDALQEQRDRVRELLTPG